MNKHATLPGLYISYTRQDAKIAFTILFLTFSVSSLGALCVKEIKKPWQRSGLLGVLCVKRNIKAPATLRLPLRPLSDSVQFSSRPG
jgi:hypothetical protein